MMTVEELNDVWFSAPSQYKYALKTFENEHFCCGTCSRFHDIDGQGVCARCWVGKVKPDSQGYIGEVSDCIEISLVNADDSPCEDWEQK